MPDSRYLDQTSELHPDSQRFMELCENLKEVHLAKSHDYGHNNQPLANFEESTRFNVRPFVGIMIRLNDKMIRIQNFIDKGNLKCEGVFDALQDIAAYALLAQIQLTKETHGPGKD